MPVAQNLIANHCSTSRAEQHVAPCRAIRRWLKFLQCDLCSCCLIVLYCAIYVHYRFGGVLNLCLHFKPIAEVACQLMAFQYTFLHQTQI